MLVIYKHMTKDQAAIYSLVLHSVGITHHILKDEDSWNILVDEINSEKAVFNIEQYLIENKN